MEVKQVKDLMEAYQKVHQVQENVEELHVNEVEEGFRPLSIRQRKKMLAREKTLTKRAMDYASREGEAAGGDRVKMGKINSALRDPKLREEVETDLFDIILEHLVAEGYADTNQNALVIMANMSEEWRSSIVDEMLDEANRAERELGLSSRERERARNLQGNLSKPIFYGKRNSQLGNTSDSGMNRMHTRLRNKRRTEHEERRGQG